MKRIASLVLLLSGTATVLHAGIGAAPEIDLAAAPAAFALLSGALLVLRSRRRR